MRPGSREGCRKVESVAPSPEVWGFGLALLYLLPLIVPCAPHPNRRGPGATFPPYYRNRITSCSCRALCFSKSIRIDHSIESHTHSLPPEGGTNRSSYSCLGRLRPREVSGTVVMMEPWFSFGLVLYMWEEWPNRIRLW